MPRRLASQVHLAVGRLLQAKVLKTPPVWYEAVTTYPPVPLPPRDSVKRVPTNLPESSNATLNSARIPFDLPARTLTQRALDESRRSKKPVKPHPLPVSYTADKIRRQFFRDHPFEAFRAQSLVERDSVRDAHSIQGKEWTRLRQHGRHPTPEDAIQFAVSLYEHHELPLTIAYHRAASQFRSLRAEHETATQFALHEAKFYGAAFAPDEVDRGTDLARRALSSWVHGDKSSGATGKRVISVRNRFTPVWKGRTGSTGVWTRGVAYTKRWKRGMPPMFWPSRKERSALKTAQNAIQAPIAQKAAEASARLAFARQSPTLSRPIV